MSKKKKFKFVIKEQTGPGAGSTITHKISGTKPGMEYAQDKKIKRSRRFEPPKKEEPAAAAQAGDAEVKSAARLQVSTDSNQIQSENNR